MGITPEIPIDNYRVEVDPTAMPRNLICVDDRMTKLMGWQHAGGPDGLGRDIATAMEVEEPNSFIDLGTPIHVVGSLMAKRLAMYDLSSYMHPFCAAHDDAKPVRTKMHAEADAVREQTAKIGIPMTEEDATKFVEASWRIDNSGLLQPRESTNNDLKNGMPDRELPPVPYVDIEPGPHVSRDLYVDLTGEAIFNSKDAYENGHAAYFAGLGTLAAVHRRIQNIVPVRRDILLKAASWRLGAVSLALPQTEQAPIRIHAIGDAEVLLAAA